MPRLYFIILVIKCSIFSLTAVEPESVHPLGPQIREQHAVAREVQRRAHAVAGAVVEIEALLPQELPRQRIQVRAGDALRTI